MSYYKSYTSITEYKGVRGTSHIEQNIGLNKRVYSKLENTWPLFITDYILFSLC